MGNFLSKVKSFTGSRLWCLLRQLMLKLSCLLNLADKSFETTLPHDKARPFSSNSKWQLSMIIVSVFGCDLDKKHDKNYIHFSGLSIEWFSVCQNHLSYGAVLSVGHTHKPSVHGTRHQLVSIWSSIECSSDDLYGLHHQQQSNFQLYKSPKLLQDDNIWRTVSLIEFDNEIVTTKKYLKSTFR